MNLSAGWRKHLPEFLTGIMYLHVILMLSPKAVLLNFMMRKLRKKLWIVQKKSVIFALRWGKNMTNVNYLDNVIRILKEYSDVVSSNPGEFTGVLYGSVARGDYNLWSDIDFLVISDELPENPLKRPEFLYSLTETPIEVKGYTRNEFLNMIEKRNPIALDSLVDGKIIVDNGFWEIARNKFEEVKKRYELVKEPKRWVSMSMKRSFLRHVELIPVVPE
jgi:predicted nucleotidyltransferase